MSLIIPNPTPEGSGPVEGVDVLSTGEVATNKYLRTDGDGTSSWQTVPAPSVEGTAVLSTGEAGGTKFLREDGDGTCSWQTVSAGSVEGTAVLSTGEAGGTKFLREDGDGTSSWQAVPSVEGTAILSTGEVATNKYLRTDGDGTCSWQTVAGGGGTVQGIDGTYDIQPTNEGAVAGNIRGENTVDLCTHRTDAANVCTGNYSGAVAGSNNGGSGRYNFFAAGQGNNNCTGNNNIIAGSNNDNCAGYDNIIGGNGHSGITSDYALIAGQSVRNEIDFAACQGGGVFDNVGSRQARKIIAYRVSTDATPSQLNTSITQYITIPLNHVFAFDIVVVAARNDASENARWSIKGLIENAAGTTTLLWSSVTKDYDDSAAWVVTVSANDAGDRLEIFSTGETGKTIRWMAVIDTVEVHAGASAPSV